MPDTRYPPEYVFSAVAVLYETPCFYCLELISPETDTDYFIASVPTSGEAIDFHVSCFEEFAWLMFTYFHHYVHRDEEEILVN